MLVLTIIIMIAQNTQRSECYCTLTKYSSISYIITFHGRSRRSCWSVFNLTNFAQLIQLVLFQPDQLKSDCYGPAGLRRKS